MKKVFKVREFTSAPSVEGGTALIVAFRRKATLFMQNLQLEPADRFQVTHDQGDGSITIKIRLSESECLVLGDDQGVASKTQIESR